MTKRRRILGIIPARAGSKRLPGKNKMLLHGKALIEWSIQTALESDLIDSTIVSTDDDDIIELANRYGDIAPFKRPQELAEDTSGVFEVIMHVIDFFKSKKQEFTHVLLLQPTSPLRNSDDLNTAIQLLNEKVKSVVSVCETEHSPLWTNTLPENGSMKDFISDKFKNVRSQDLPTFYRLNGSLYLSEISYFIENKGFLGADTYALVMPAIRSVDIDNKIDFELCKILMNENS